MRKLETRWGFCRAQFKIRFPQGYVIDAEEPPHLPARIIAKRLTTSLPACTSYLTQGIQAMCRVGSGMPALASSSSTFDASLRQGTLSRAHPRLERPTAYAPAHRLKIPDASTSVQPPTTQYLGASSYTAQSFACEYSISAALPISRVRCFATVSSQERCRAIYHCTRRETRILQDSVAML